MLEYLIGGVIGAIAIVACAGVYRMKKINKRNSEHYDSINKEGE